jgi:hypothetical protein
VLDLICENVRTEAAAQAEVIDQVVTDFNAMYGVTYTRTELHFERSALETLAAI